MVQIIKRVLGLRDKFGIGRKIPIQKMGVNRVPSGRWEWTLPGQQTLGTCWEVFANRLGAAVPVEGGPRVVVGDRERDSVGTATNDEDIRDDATRGQGGRSACPHSRAYGNSGGAVAPGLHSQGGRGGNGGGSRVGRFLHG